MNNLMTKSFLSYVDLKKQVCKDTEIASECDIESGFFPFTNVEQENLSLFFSDVEPIQAEITSLSALLSDLTRLYSESKTTHTRNLLRGLKDQMDSDVASILRKAHSIKSSLASLDASNAGNQTRFGLNSPLDRTRTAVTNGLRSKVWELMNGFSALRENITEEHYYKEEGVKKSNDIETGGQVYAMDSAEVVERDKAVSELRKSLSRLHQVFLDMAVMVEVQRDQLEDIEENVVKAKDYISGGTGQLADAEGLRRRSRRRWAGCWGFLLVVMVVILVCLILRFAD